VSSDNVQKWLDDYRTKEGRTLSAVSFNSYRRYLSLFFSFCVKRGWLATNPVARVSQQRVTTKVPRLLMPSDLKLILNASSGDLRTAIALQAFCGLRSSEVARVRWTDVLLNESGNYIQIGADTAKTSRRRLTPIPDNLLPLLHRDKKPDGFIYATGKGKPDAIQKALVSIRKSLRDISWGRNALRASALSYRLAITKDVSATALEMGNSPEVLMRDYRELTTPAQAVEWFGLIMN
jgi:integrase